METSEKNINRVPDNLLSFLRKELGERKIEYEVFPSQIKYGNETTIFRFRLKKIHASLSGPLILRMFRKSHKSNHAILESAVHNSLVTQGFPVPYVYYCCTDPEYLGCQFLIMDLLPGVMLPSVFGDDTNIVLGKTHAALHKADPGQFHEDLIKNGLEKRQYSLEGRLNQLLEASEKFSWLGEIVEWLFENKPPECEQPSICHGDFHPENLLARDGEVSAILDWSCCRIGDPAMDVASTLVIYNAATKHLVPLFDAEIETQKYLEAYTRKRELNTEHLEYYQVLGCVIALAAGAKGVKVWTQAPIENDLIKLIYNFSKINVEVPGGINI